MSREKIIEETKPFINNARSLIIIICHGKMPQLYTTLTHQQQKKDVNVQGDIRIHECGKRRPIQCLQRK